MWAVGGCTGGRRLQKASTKGEGVAIGRSGMNSEGWQGSERVSSLPKGKQLAQGHTVSEEQTEGLLTPSCAF